MNDPSNARPLIQIEQLRKYFPVEKGFMRRVVGQVKAVDDVSLYINEGETLGLVGESGSGKTTLGRCVARAIEPTSGSIKFRNNTDQVVDLASIDRKALHEIRGSIQMVFQDPNLSLDPRWTVMDIVGEPIKIKKKLVGKELEHRVVELMETVGLETTHLKNYPHAFSGGQRQRIGVARALASNPKLIVADEPVSALDVSIQAQILNLLKDLQDQFGLTFLFISHDLSVVEHISDRVAVMYVGKTVELARTEELFTVPKHPYTEALLSAVPKPDPDLPKRRILLKGEIANPANPPSGCYFHPRCNYAKDICIQKTPEWREVSPGHFAACHFAGDLSLKGVSG